MGERQTEDPYVSSVVTISEIWRSRVRSAVATPFWVFFCLPPKLSYSNVFSYSPRDPRRSTSRRAPCSRHRRTEHTDNPRAPTEHAPAMVRAVARRTRSSRGPPTLPGRSRWRGRAFLPLPRLFGRRSSLAGRGARRHTCRGRTRVSYDAICICSEPEEARGRRIPRRHARVDRGQLGSTTRSRLFKKS